MVSGLVFADELPRSTIASRVARGELIRLASGIYSTEVGREPDDIVREHLYEIVGRLMPKGVITDRSARTGVPVGQVLYLARPGRARDIELPGIRVRARPGAGPQHDDIELPGGLHLASWPRAIAENAMPSRARSGTRRTFDDAELGDWIDYLCQNEGPERLAQYRRRAEELAPVLGVGPSYLAKVQSVIGIAIGTRPGDKTASTALTARLSGKPVDQLRVRRIELLAEALRSAAPQSNPFDTTDPGRYRYEPFFEAYFSNFIEGTEFDVDEAARIVFDGEIPPDRPRDAHDVIGTHRLVTDPEEMIQTGITVEEFLELIRRRNSAIMDHRPDKHPGHFKQIANRAGGTYFVEPDLVEGTLAAGFRLRERLDTGWERGVFIAFVVSEVHPFDDGNGRTARIMLNAELTAAGQHRIIVPTVYREDYLDGLRGMSRRDDPTILIKTMRYAHDFTAAIDFTDYAEAKAQLTDANAFEEPDSSRRLRIPGRRAPSTDAPWRATNFDGQGVSP